jgi:hypothetical protein
MSRTSPWPALMPDWSELLTFAFAVTNATVESHVLRPIYGPFCIDEMTIAQTATDGRNMHVYLATDDDNSEPTAIATLAARVPRQTATDTVSQTNNIPSVTSWQHVRVNYVSRRGIARLSIVAQNDQAAPQSVWGSIAITHLLPLAAVAGYV